MMMTRLVSWMIGVALALSRFSAATAFALPCPRATSLRIRATDNADVEPAVDKTVADIGTSTEPCEGYPKCDGAYRDKGCDGSGRIAGGVGAVLPWFPVKAFRPCPSFTEAKYKYDRSGQSLNEVMFARKRTRKTERKEASNTPTASDSTDEEVQ